MHSYSVRNERKIHISAAQDYDIASMASLLNTDIHVYLYKEGQPSQKVTFQPHPLPRSLRITTTPIPDIHIWNEKYISSSSH